MAADGVGPSQTCASLLSAMARGGLSGPLFVNRARAKRPGVSYQTALPGFLASLPYKYVEATATRRSELCFRRTLREGDIAYLWPHASLQAYHWAKSLGVPIVGEGINSRMASARTILDEAYDAEGLSPGHGITDARIAEEEEKLAMTDIFFAPSPGVESALVGSQLPESALLSTSYGVDLDRAPAPSLSPVRRNRPVFLFVGWGSVRKGLHLLLRGWVEAGIDAELWIAGQLEPALQERFAPHLERDDVRTLGFVRDVDALYSQADAFVLPSLEEGDPLVTYEAAARGLPIIATTMGGGRLGDAGHVRIVDPLDPGSIATALRDFALDPETRAQWAARSTKGVRAFDWSDVGLRRAHMLAERLGLELGEYAS
ncbi:Glycosyltransferase involved in cell wall bisynthesis [Salipiger thiooxidans]|uniref:Glycosyltransferase involved in cell wall bisynthesis n=1 Tax=Salipiger thiooxidans TaxID=282683 RepID=A0A1G7E002_9RHOB|nr:Glycosyltransferase involved in cell wall bisynthesis [Salipiger thiooxidans]